MAIEQSDAPNEILSDQAQSQSTEPDSSLPQTKPAWFPGDQGLWDMVQPQSRWGLDLSHDHGTYSSMYEHLNLKSWREWNETRLGMLALSSRAGWILASSTAFLDGVNVHVEDTFRRRGAGDECDGHDAPEIAADPVRAMLQGDLIDSAASTLARVTTSQGTVYCAEMRTADEPSGLWTIWDLDGRCVGNVFGDIKHGWRHGNHLTSETSRRYPSFTSALADRLSQITQSGGVQSDDLYWEGVGLPRFTEPAPDVSV